MWINTVEPDRPQITILSTRIASWIRKAKHSHSFTQLLHQQMHIYKIYTLLTYSMVQSPS